MIAGAGFSNISGKYKNVVFIIKNPRNRNKYWQCYNCYCLLPNIMTDHFPTPTWGLVTVPEDNQVHFEINHGRLLFLEKGGSRTYPYLLLVIYLIFRTEKYNPCNNVPWASNRQVYINTMKTTFDFNFHLYLAFKQHGLSMETKRSC